MVARVRNSFCRFEVNWFKLILTLIRYVWTSPNTLLGLGWGLLGVLSGGRLQCRQGCLEFSGGILTPLLRRLPPRGVRAITLGHAIIGVDPEALDDCRTHEQIHVRQFELWGPFFLVAYTGCSVYLWLRNRDYYFENPFEVEAYSKDGKSGCHVD
jgi:hypothetical protein